MVVYFVVANLVTTFTVAKEGKPCPWVSATEATANGNRVYFYGAQHDVSDNKYFVSKWFFGVINVETIDAVTYAVVLTLISSILCGHAIIAQHTFPIHH